MTTIFITMIATLLFNEPVLPADEYILVRDTELRQYTIEFLTKLDEYNVKYDKNQKIIVRFNKLLGRGVAGAAYGMFHKEYTTVFINPQIWKLLNNDQKRWLVFHELSHDMFDMRHHMSDIMHPTTPSAKRASMKIEKKMDFHFKKLRTQKAK